MKKSLLAATVGLMMSLPLSMVHADEAAIKSASVSGTQSLKAQAQTKLVSAFGPRLEVSEVAPLAGGQILEVILTDGTVMHMTPDLSHFLYRDELYEFGAAGAENVTQNRHNPTRAAEMAALGNNQTVVFEAKGEQKGLINVFTDIDCGYCQKLHQEVPRLNELGITVRYLAFPRAGIKNPQTGQLTDSYRKINYVWCQDDRKAAMNTMKTTQRELNVLGQRLRQGGAVMLQDQYNALSSQMGDMIAASNDCGAPIAEEYNMGKSMGVNGTPAIVLEDGRLFPGYLPADELARRMGIL
ncbi:MULTISPECIES: thioredoxin fold domain-containing protein [unclassified Thalassolituus]|uniref:thioredoxin fold domain-containing protein n=1 Tax=unclassified Thalassolituus TaxID=2624967 RepID=UPI0025E1ABF3|nr:MULTISPECIES: thioredoxin fold domain-containing protein [unclassified Thalassolituus]|tara:strand:- start:1334 stop:2227 length:894 start_codon:yes stop_codon:yes gene_type:complete